MGNVPGIIQSSCFLHPAATSWFYSLANLHPHQKVHSMSKRNVNSKPPVSGTSLVVQSLRIRLPMQGTRVWALVQEDRTCRGATKPVRHNYWARAPRLLKPECLERVLCNKRSHRNEKRLCTTMKSSPLSQQLEKARAQQRRPNAA